jgi:hypothetical protein
MRGVHACRAIDGVDLDLRILSAGHGLLAGDEPVKAYDATFAGRTASQIDLTSADLRIRADVADLLGSQYDLGLLLLGADYLRAAGVLEVDRLSAPTFVFCGAGRKQATQYGCGLVGLKGEMAGRLLFAIASVPSLLHRVIEDPNFDMEGCLAGPSYSRQLSLVA